MHFVDGKKQSYKQSEEYIKKNKIILHKQNTYIFELEIKNN